MMIKRGLLRLLLILIAVIVIVVVGIGVYQNANGKSSYPDFSKTVYINCKYSDINIDIKLNPDHTSEYSISNDSYKYRGKWETIKQGKAVEINIDLTHDPLSNKNDKIEGSILIYDSKNGKSLAAIPLEVMNMPEARVYGKWKQ